MHRAVGGFWVMELTEYIRLARKWFWLILLAAVLAGGMSFLLRSRQQAVYQADVMLSVGGYIQSPNPDTYEIYTGELLAQTYAGLRIYRDRDFDYLLSRFVSALGSAVAVGFIEETIFRGYILHTLSQSISRYKSILVTSFIFALVHIFTLDYFMRPIKEVQLDGTYLLAGWNHVFLFLKPLSDPFNIMPGLIGLFLTGLLLAELTVKAGNLWPAIGLHAGLVFSLQFTGKILRYRPGPDAGPAWFYGEKFVPAGVVAWIILCALILWVRNKKPS